MLFYCIASWVVYCMGFIFLTFIDFIFLLFVFPISFEITTGSSTQCYKCIKSKSVKYQTAASIEIIIKFKVNFFNSFIYTKHTHSAHLHTHTYTHTFQTLHNGWNSHHKTHIQMIVFFVNNLFFIHSLLLFRYFAIFRFLFFLHEISTKSEKSVSTNSLASPPISSFNGAGMVTQLLPLKLADKKVSFFEFRKFIFEWKKKHTHDLRNSSPSLNGGREQHICNDFIFYSHFQSMLPCLIHPNQQIWPRIFKIIRQKKN